MRFWKFAPLLAALALAAPARAQEKPISLADAVQIGLENNHQIQIVTRERQVAQNNNTLANAGALPTLTASVNFNNRYDDRPNQAFPDQRFRATTNSVSPNLNLNWVLFNGFAVSASRESLSLQEEAAQVAYAATIEQTLQQVILAYHDASLQKERLEVTAEVMALSRDRYQYVLSRKELGSAVTFEVLQEQNAFLSDSSNYLLQKINFENSLRALNLAMGEQPDAPYLPSERLSPMTQAYDLQQMVAKAEAENKNLQSLRLSRSLNETAIDQARTALYPRVTLNLGTDFQGSRFALTVEEQKRSITTTGYDFYGNLGVAYTIFDGQNRHRQIENAQLQHEIAQVRVEQAQLQLASQVVSANAIYEARKQVERVAEQNLEAARLNLQIAEDKYKSGAINSFDYRAIQMLYLQSALAAAQAKFDLVDSHTQLVVLTGGLVSEGQ